MKAVPARHETADLFVRTPLNPSMMPASLPCSSGSDRCPEGMNLTARNNPNRETGSANQRKDPRQPTKPEMYPIIGAPMRLAADIPVMTQLMALAL